MRLCKRPRTVRLRNSYNTGMDTEQSGTPYAGLTPDCVLDALDSVGLRGDGRAGPVHGAPQGQRWAELLHRTL